MARLRTLRDTAFRTVRAVTMAAGRTMPAAMAVTALERLAPAPTGRFAVLTYHRVGARDPSAGYPGLVSATAEEFARQIEHVATHCRPVSAAEVVAARRGEVVLPARSVLVTFDDAYDDFDRIAWPVLRDLGVPPVLFVPTGFPDSGHAFWWDRLYHALRETSRPSLSSFAGVTGRPLAVGGPAADRAFRAIRAVLKERPHAQLLADVATIEADLGVTTPPARVLGWEALRRLRDDGVTLAPHSVTHPLLTMVTPGEAAQEIGDSIEELRAQTAADVPLFAYPSGAHDPGVVAAVEAAGIEVAFTTERGVNDPARSDWLRLGRLNVGRAGLQALRAQMAWLGGSPRSLHRRRLVPAGE